MTATPTTLEEHQLGIIALTLGQDPELFRALQEGVTLHQESTAVPKEAQVQLQRSFLALSLFHVREFHSFHRHSAWAKKGQIKGLRDQFHTVVPILSDSGVNFDRMHAWLKTVDSYARPSGNARPTAFPDALKDLTGSFTEEQLVAEGLCDKERGAADAFPDLLKSLFVTLRRRT